MGKDESQEDFLIWFISFGEQNNKEMTFFSILSILHYTNYKGDIIVLSDQDQFTTPIDRVKFINVKDKYPLNNKFNIYCIKPKITDFIDITKYKYCLYMDSDILVNEPKFQELLYSWSESNKIMVIDNEGWKVHRNVASTGRNSLTEEEKEKYKDFEVCAGLFGVPGNEVGLNFLKLWDDINSLDYNADDQGNLYALLLRNPIDYFYCPNMNYDRFTFSKINHYHSKYKNLFWMHSQYILRNFLVDQKFDGTYMMHKPCENLINYWEFKNGQVFTKSPTMTGLVQSTIFATYIWWYPGGFEKITNNGNYSSKQMDAAFTLAKIVC